MKHYLINKEDFEIQVIENEAIFQNKISGTVYFFNELAFKIYKLIENENSIQEIINIIYEKYPETDFCIIENDCISIVKELEDSKLVVKQNSSLN